MVINDCAQEQGRQGHLRGIEAGEGRAKDFEEPARGSQGVEHVVVVGVRVVAVPVQDVIAHVQGVARNVGRGVAQ